MARDVLVAGAEACEIAWAPSIETVAGWLFVRPAASVPVQLTAWVPSPSIGTSPGVCVALTSLAALPSTAQASAERFVSVALTRTVGAEGKKPLAGADGVTVIVTAGSAPSTLKLCLDRVLLPALSVTVQAIVCDPSPS